MPATAKSAVEVVASNRLLGSPSTLRPAPSNSVRNASLNTEIFHSVCPPGQTVVFAGAHHMPVCWTTAVVPTGSRTTSRVKATGWYAGAGGSQPGGGAAAGLGAGPLVPGIGSVISAPPWGAARPAPAANTHAATAPTLTRARNRTT